MNDLKVQYEAYWNFLGTVQIPHHGSKDNFHIDLVDCCIFSVMSAGKYNRYGHPHSCVVDKIKSKNSIPVVVTEQENTKSIQKIIF